MAQPQYASGAEIEAEQMSGSGAEQAESAAHNALKAKLTLLTASR